MGDEEAQQPLSATVLCVRYTGTSNIRVLSRKDLLGDTNAPLDEATNDQLVWTPGSEIAYSFWLAYAGSEERAQEVLSKHAHEFELVGPAGVQAIEGEEEFVFEQTLD